MAQAIFHRTAKAGKRADLGDQYFRSSWEANMARYFNWLVTHRAYINGHQLLSWEFEVDEFEFPVKRGTRFYWPDFKLTFADGRIEYWEIKGYMDQKSKTALDRMARHHPDVKVVLVDGPAYHAIARKVAALVPGWE